MNIYVIFISEYFCDTIYQAHICRAETESEAKEIGEFYIKKHDLKGKIQFIIKQNEDEYNKHLLNTDLVIHGR